MNPDESPGRPDRTLAAQVFITFILGALLVLVARYVPLPAVEISFVSGYGVMDNRRLLLTFAALVLAILLGPLPAVIFRRRAAVDHEKLPASMVPAAGRVGLSARSLLIATFAAALVFGILFVGPGVALAPLNGHEVMHFGYLNEIRHGRLLNVDTRILYGPLQGYSCYGFMRLFGFHLVGFRLYWNVVTALCLTILFVLLLRRMNNRLLLALIMVYVTLFTTAHYHLPDARGVNGGFWGWANMLRHGWVTLAALFLAEPLQRAGLRPARRTNDETEPARELPWASFAAGVIAAFGGIYAQDTAPQGFVALGALIVLSHRDDLKRLFGIQLPSMLAGAAAGLILTLLPVLARGAAPEFLVAMFGWSGLFLKGAGNLPFPSLVQGDAASRLAALPYYFVPAVGLGFLFHNWTGFLRGVRVPPLEAVLSIYAVLSTVSLLVRADSAHLYNITLAPIVLSFLFLDRVLSGAATGSDPPGRPSIPRSGGSRSANRPAFFRSHGVPVLLLCLPVLFASPGAVDVVKGFSGRILHPVPAPPAGWQEIPFDRARIWTPAGDWFDNEVWGRNDTPATVRMITTLAAGRPIYIVSRKASLYYFLADAPCAVPYTDLSTQCVTDLDNGKLIDALRRNDALYVFWSEETAGAGIRGGAGNPSYRALGLHHGFYVFERKDLPMTSPETLSGE